MERTTDLGVISIETGIKLGEVAISAQKKRIEQKVDHLVLHVENAIGASGGDALDALKITPRLRVENDKLSMIGKGSLRVMVNGHILPLSGADLTNYLQSISADNIKSIEVITTPPARYEAEGDGGLINVVLKKSKANYIGVSVFGAYRQQTYGDYALGTHINYQRDKLSLYTHVNRGKGAKHPLEEQTFYYGAFTLHNEST